MTRLFQRFFPHSLIYQEMTFLYMPVPYLQIGMLSVFSLSREKENKRILRTWILSKDEVKETKYEALRAFVLSNLTTLINRPETEFRSRLKSKATTYALPSIDARREQSPAYVVRFERRTNKKEVLGGLRSPKNLEEFQKTAREVAQWFANTQRWPRSYLFVTYFEVIEGAVRIRLTGILTADVSSNVFVEDPSRVVDLLKQGVISQNAKKALIFPHIIGKEGDSIISEELVKVYEETPTPSQYFYSFADLVPPKDPEEIIGQVVHDVSAGPAATSMQRLSSALRVDDETSAAVELVSVKLIIDDVVVSMPFKTFERNVRLFRFPDGRKGVVLVGRSVACVMGGRDLVEAKLASFAKADGLDDLFER